MLRLPKNPLPLALLATVLAFPYAVRAGDSEPTKVPKQDFFERKIRPVLVEHCYACHSAQAKTEGKLKGGLRLDVADGWRSGGDSGRAIVPGKPEESLLLAALRYESFEMPPKGKLSPAVINDFAAWIAAGATDPRTDESASKAPKSIDIEAGRKHWAYQPPRTQPLPDVKSPGAAANAIDRFVLAKLDAANLTPAPEADHVTLARRLYFDLLGLPPTPEEIDEFTADGSPDAYGRLADRLLASPRFGERWGRHWLDVARYAESLTLRGFILPDAWRYRDYVIRAFNDDLPFDEFIREQVAGDLLESDAIEKRQQQFAATSFLAIGNTNLEEQDKKQLDMDLVDEQLDVLGKAILGQTIACARCHDHKFDPIPTRDYYAMAGILRGAKALEHENVSKWMQVPLPLPPEDEERAKRHAAELAAVESKLKAVKAKLEKRANRANGSVGIVAISKLPGIIVDDAQGKRVGQWQASTSTKAYVGDGYLHDQNDAKGEKTITFTPKLPKAGKYEVRLGYVAGGNRAARVPVTVFSADGEATIHVNQQAPPPIAGHFISLGQYQFETDNQGFVIVATEGTTGHVIADAVQFIPVEELGGTGGSPTSAGSKKDTTSNETDAEAQEAARLEEQRIRLEKAAVRRPTVVSVVDSGKGADLPIHIRGSVHTLGQIAPRGFLQVAASGSPQIPANQSGRRQLAEWLASSDNPLTARVYANRAWHWLFGAGIVRTVDNFGATGEPPSHAELLDHLALEMARDEWSTKSLVRRIVATQTYRRTEASDPENRLLAHANRRRLDAEALRDAMLAISGELRLDAAGATYPAKLTADYGYRHVGTERSVFVPAFRNATSDILAVFDAADPSLVTGRRDSSTVAPQALVMLNHPFVHEQAEKAAARLLAANLESDAARIRHATRAVLGREPSPAERDTLTAFLAESPGKRAWTEIYLALFASVDFRYVD